MNEDLVFIVEGTSEYIHHVDRKHTNLRTDLAWISSMKARVINPPFIRKHLNEFKAKKAIAIIPKLSAHDFIELLKEIRPNIGELYIMQEGPNWYWQDWPIETQLEYFQFLCDPYLSDAILVHNQNDISYYRGLLNRDAIYTMPSLMITDSLQFDIKSKEEREGVIIGGNFVSWYGGFDSMMIALHLNDEVYVPSMGRMQKGESKIGNLKQIPYMEWNKWMEVLNTKKYAVHLMRTFAAGTFALNCAYLGIPCIGYDYLDTQKLCFPELSVDTGDMQTAREIAIELKDDSFYDEVSKYAKQAYKKYFSEEAFISKMKLIGILDEN